ncbi:MAG TPA: polysaccharide deacetylase family protein [Abditibacteriaceae bacterium]|jgi:peptidoglycan/xylan/chitin deacetylase (PgdA/CDA1 family)
MNFPKRVEAARFPANKRIAVTFSFDDGVDHDRRVVEWFNAHGLKATWNLNSGSLKREGKPYGKGHLDVSEIADLFRGHEVAIHTVSHPMLTHLDTAQIAREVLEDRIELENIVGYPVRGMAYPFGNYDTRVIEVLRTLGVVYSRTCENKAQPFPVAEPLAWPATMHQYDESQGTVPERFSKMLENPHESGVFFVWGHTYEFDGRDDWDALDRLFLPLCGHDDVWYCTNIELFDYEEARQRLVIAANRGSVYNPSGLAVTVKVDGKLVEVPAGATISLTA